MPSEPNRFSSATTERVANTATRAMQYGLVDASPSAASYVTQVCDRGKCEHTRALQLPDGGQIRCTITKMQLPDSRESYKRVGSQTTNRQLAEWDAENAALRKLVANQRADIRKLESLLARRGCGRFEMPIGERDVRAFACSGQGLGCKQVRMSDESADAHPLQKQQSLIGFKLVAKADEDRYFSLWAGRRVEFKFGKAIEDVVEPHRNSGIDVFRTVAEAMSSYVPGKSFTASNVQQCKRVVLRCRCSGPFVHFPKGKVACSRLVPLEEVWLESPEALNTPEGSEETSNQHSPLSEEAALLYAEVRNLLRPPRKLT